MRVRVNHDQVTVIRELSKRLGISTDSVGEDLVEFGIVFLGLTDLPEAERLAKATEVLAQSGYGPTARWVNQVWERGGQA